MRFKVNFPIFCLKKDQYVFISSFVSRFFREAKISCKTNPNGQLTICQS